MKSYLVDVPTQINIWIRPELQSKQWEIIKKARPSVLLIVSDGGRTEDEWESIISNRKMIEEGIDWECEVYKLYKDENIGVKKMIMETHEFVWEKVDKCIFLEDDIIPSVSFFRYCKELLDKYENDYRINAICGMNHLGVSENVNSDYFFSRQGSIWGYALWKRTYLQYYNYEYEKDTYIWNLLKNETRKDPRLWKSINGIKRDKNIYFSPTEFFMDLCMFSQNQLLIIPKKNMICCEGASRDAHGADSINRLPRGIRHVFFMKTHDLEFPLVHPQFVIPDEQYKKRRNSIIGRNHPIKNYFRKIERALYIIKDGDIKYLWKKIRK